MDNNFLNNDSMKGNFYILFYKKMKKKTDYLK